MPESPMGENPKKILHRSVRRIRKEKYMYNPGQWQEKQAVDFYEDCREIEKERAKAAVRESVKLEAARCRQQFKEAEEERKRSICEEVQILSSGELQIVTRNLLVDAKPRHFTNMETPRLTILKRIEDETEKIYLVECEASGRGVQVFLSSDKAGNGTYILRKFASAGIWFSHPTANTKKIAVRIICALMEGPVEEHWLADCAGWMKRPDGKFIFIDEEAITWEKARKFVK